MRFTIWYGIFSRSFDQLGAMLNVNNLYFTAKELAEFQIRIYNYRFILQIGPILYDIT